MEIRYKWNGINEHLNDRRASNSSIFAIVFEDVKYKN